MVHPREKDDRRAKVADERISVKIDPGDQGSFATNSDSYGSVDLTPPEKGSCRMQGLRVPCGSILNPGVRWNVFQVHYGCSFFT